MLGVFAEFETNLRRERQLEGIAKAKAAGVYKGRPVSIDSAQVRAMKAQGLGASEIAKALKIGRASVYRVLEAADGCAAGETLPDTPDSPHTRKRPSHAKNTTTRPDRPDSRSYAEHALTAPGAVAKAVKIGRAWVYRVLEDRRAGGRLASGLPTHREGRWWRGGFGSGTN
jgi:hypothetical protein